MAVRPTDEQEAARDAFVQGRDLALIAGAGTGKTSTLILMGASVPKKRGIYVSFNREIAENAKTRFGPNVQCRTAHSLAFQHVGSTSRTAWMLPRTFPPGRPRAAWASLPSWTRARRRSR
jgi:hypothetical protein